MAIITVDGQHLLSRRIRILWEKYVIRESETKGQKDAAASRQPSTFTEK